MSIKSNKGTTLVELMVSIAIFGIIASAAMGLLLYATNINSNVTADSVESGRVYQVLDFVKQNCIIGTVFKNKCLLGIIPYEFARFNLKALTVVVFS